jgi:hypothetical protein
LHPDFGFLHKNLLQVIQVVRPVMSIELQQDHRWLFYVAKWTRWLRHVAVAGTTSLPIACELRVSALKLAGNLERRPTNLAA